MTDEQAASDPEQERALGKMSFMEHLGELRTRIVWALGSAGVGLVIAFFVAATIVPAVRAARTDRGRRVEADRLLRVPVVRAPGLAPIGGAGVL